MMGLSDGRKSFRIGLAVLIQYRSVTDTQPATQPRCRSYYAQRSGVEPKNGRNSNFEGLVTLTLTLDPAIRHTVVHHSSTSTYIPNFIKIEETFCGRTDIRTYGRTDIFPPLILLGRLLEVDLKMPQKISIHCRPT